MILRDLQSYMPPIYKDVKETDEVLSIEQQILNLFLSDQDATYKNTFVLTADEEGIRLYEDLLEILPDPSVETLEFRKERVINRLCLRYPFTWVYLINNILNSFLGVGKYECSIDYNSYTLTLKSHIGERNKLHELLVTLYKIIPANIVFIAENEIVCYTIGNKFHASVVSPCFHYQLSSYLRETYKLDGNKIYVGVSNPSYNLVLTSNRSIHVESTGEKKVAGAVTTSMQTRITSSISARYKLSGDKVIAGAITEGSRVELTSGGSKSYEAEGDLHQAGALSLNTKYELE